MDQIIQRKRCTFADGNATDPKMKKTSPEIHELKHQIESRLNRRMKTPSDFIFLSGVIWERTHETMSPTTLKRLWGYIDGADETRSSTLDILSRTLGFRDWEEFLDTIRQDNGSTPVLSPHISIDDLVPGDRVAVSWKPDRRCVFRYLGDGGFVVEQAQNSKLKVGDTFSASLFILHEPLYLSRLVQGSKPPVSFVVGNKAGLCEIERIPGLSELSQVETERA